MIRCRSSSIAMLDGELNLPASDPLLPSIENKSDRSIDDKNTNRLLLESTMMMR